MCRRNLLWGCIMIAFGAGVLIGIWLEGDFLCHCAGIALILAGCGCLRKK